uniref:Lipid-binding serum glycoprotein N-terminal domain-containing protein n=1 Tax=Tetranychus urticae TaxID=32264 RepID=T1K0P0_TETUR
MFRSQVKSMFLVLIWTLLCTSLNSLSIPSSSDSLSMPPMLSNQVQSLVMSSFEAYRRLLRDSGEIQDFLREKMCLPQMTPVSRLDPLPLTDVLTLEDCDPITPEVGRLVTTINNIRFYGLSDFRVETVETSGSYLHFRHKVPKLDSRANYTVDYHLFGSIPLRISQGEIRSTIVNAHINGTFQMFPDVFRSWFRVSHLGIQTACHEPMDLTVYPEYTITDRFVVDRQKIDKFSDAMRSILPKVGDYLKFTYSKAAELKSKA